MGPSIEERDANAELVSPQLSEIKTQDVVEVSPTTDGSDANSATEITHVPLYMKLLSVLMVSAIGFGAHWSSGVTGAMKKTLKRELHIDNTKFALLEASEDFMVTVLIMFSGLATDRVGGAGAMLWGNALFTVGSILIAAAATVRSFKFMIFGRVVAALGDIATQVAQYKVFSSWFAPNHGFASTLGLELGIGKIGSFVGKSTANIIAKKTGDFSWVFWTSVFMNLFTNVATLIFWFFTRYANKLYTGHADPATGERLTEKNKKFEVKKALQLPWPFWCTLLFSLFQTSCALVFSQNSTELAEQRFNISSVTAGWYSALSQYAGFFLVPCIGAFVDLFGNRLTLLSICGSGMLLAMVLVTWAPTRPGTGAAFGIYAIASTFGPTVIIDSIRTAMWHQEVFGSAYAAKIQMNNSMNIIVRIVTGAIQDRDDNSYDRVVIVYVILAAASVAVAGGLLVTGWFKVDLGRLQWTKKQRLRRGDVINAQRERFEEERGERNRRVSLGCFGALSALVAGSWAAYIWGACTGNNGHQQLRDGLHVTTGAFPARPPAPAPAQSPFVRRDPGAFWRQDVCRLFLHPRLANVALSQPAPLIYPCCARLRWPSRCPASRLRACSETNDVSSMHPSSSLSRLPDGSIANVPSSLSPHLELAPNNGFSTVPHDQHSLPSYHSVLQQAHLPVPHSTARERPPDIPLVWRQVSAKEI
ncbi:uncharacterized protein K452DRAFT_97120 [Aplosporella prunicola CBS 121167]|uniref:Lysosomal dipeptide transporter MFSD1 n=1 Tax=Aplosporella prunicola CBS 121167 TaxID=1176127 RepID=A0A6A6B161_9PEZI|nr:uncharacterized protein K452DRAFT_97120 [Aplosporella prunicola CBS 121167]KAF2137932.1 hypothetical protein K452DRAFT_97120 [Aplosporella prunicola CBS 121167]